MRLVFVYGTLRRGQRNDIARYQPAPRFVASAETNGTLYHLGAYPGLVLDTGSTVVGEVYEILPELERQLDALEGITPTADDEYFKREISIALNGQPQLCLVYEINPALTLGKPVIASGDWLNAGR
jgi:gamma-glutamylcyclotransferase (GGCT)/AIG2-like uncharacterized protein YtfP